MFDQDGADVVFIAGTPGSKWSAIAHAVMYADGVNTSDISFARSYDGNSKTLHFGNYFGPGMEFGRKFDRLEAMSKQELLKEFAAPYCETGGIKLLKSHLFSQHLPFLAGMFPQARFLLVHRPDEKCLKWWEQAGGFTISYPDYSWYGTSENVAKEIERDNAGILAFAAMRNAKLVRRRSMAPILDALGLRYSSTGIKALSETEFERKWGLGNQPVEAVEADCHAMARLASVCVI